MQEILVQFVPLFLLGMGTSFIVVIVASTFVSGIKALLRLIS